MDFRVDKTTVVEGDIIEVYWDCPQSDSVNLTIDNGYKKSTLPLDKNGSKRFRLHRSKGKTSLTLTITAGDHIKKHTLKVKVKPMQVTQSETVYPNGKTGFWEGVKYRFRNFREKIRAAWRQLSHKQQMAFIILGLILLGVLLSFLAPILLGILAIGLIVYLVVSLLRR